MSIKPGILTSCLSNVLSLFLLPLLEAHLQLAETWL